jgi:HlyD family secretion protein
MTSQTASAPSHPTESRAKLPGASPIAGPTKLPSSKSPRRRNRWIMVGVVVVVCAVTAVAAGVSRSHTVARKDLEVYKVKPDRLEQTVVERGALESGKNCDVYCRVKSGAKNSTVSTTIKTVIDDGSKVNQGDLLVTLDDSGLIEQLKTQKITVDKAESDKIQAEEKYKIQVSQNESDIKTAEVNLELAKIDLQKYLEGEYPQSLKDVNGRIKTAESDLEQQRDRTAWSRRMLKKGYQTVSQTQSEESKLESYEIALAKVMEEKRVLTDPVYGNKKRDETAKTNAVAEAVRALTRVKSQAAANEVTTRTDRESKTSVYNQELSHYHDIEEEIRKCKIYSPQDGMVVYYIPEQARFGGGSQQSIVAQGEPVREDQKLMQIPDLHYMLVNTKVHEAMVGKVRQGQPAAVRIDAFPDKVFTGHVDSIATISSQQDFWAPDVKVYTTKVAIDGVVDGLKPGMNAEVKITIGDPLERVLTIPIQSIVGAAELGSKRCCFVLTPNGPEQRDITIGSSNERVAEITEGLQEGDLVIENPKAIVGDKMKTRQAGSAPGADGRAPGDSPEGGGHKGKGKRPAGPASEGGGSPSAAGGPGMQAGPQGGGGPPGGAPSAEDRQKRQQEMLQRFKAAPAEKRAQMLEEIPEQYRDRVKEVLKANGVEIK